MIRKATKKDISRIAEILVFSKRVNYRGIFQDDMFSFGELQVLSVAKKYLDHPQILEKYFVYDDGFVKGLIQIEGLEVKELYVDPFFVGKGIGGQLLEFSIEQFRVRFLWALEKNEKALAFYERHGFHKSVTWQYQEGTTERLVKLER